MPEMQGRGSARSEAREPAVDGYTSLGCARGTASVGKVRALLSLQLSSVPGECREREKEPQVSKKRSPRPSLLRAPASLSLASLRML